MQTQTGWNALCNAERLAEKLVKWLIPASERIEIAGSVRRRKPEVHDIELVAISKPRRPAFGDPPSLNGADALTALLEQMIRQQKIAKMAQGGRWGERYKCFQVYSEGFVLLPINIDLFIVQPPAQWGSIFSIRTGPSEFNRAMILRGKRMGIEHSQGALKRLATGKPIDTPEEDDYFHALGLEWIPPQERFAARVERRVL